MNSRSQYVLVVQLSENRLHNSCSWCQDKKEGQKEAEKKRDIIQRHNETDMPALIRKGFSALEDKMDAQGADIKTPAARTPEQKQQQYHGGMTPPGKAEHE